jgi:hypothetical protein
MVTRVLVDANVLYSRTLRDWLFLLKLRSEAGMFTIASTVDIVVEAVARYRDSNPIVDGMTIAAMHDGIVSCLDERVDDYTIDGSFPGADQGDAHVHAAAKACGAGIVLTCDTGWDKLTQPQLDALPYEVHDPDYFFCIIDDAAPSIVRQVIEEQIDYWMRKRGEVDLPARLRAATCPEFAERVRRHLQSM